MAVWPHLPKGTIVNKNTLPTRAQWGRRLGYIILAVLLAALFGIEILGLVLASDLPTWGGRP